MKDPIWHNDSSARFMKIKQYLKPGENINDRINEIGKEAGEYLKTAGYKDNIDEWITKFIEYTRQGYFSLSTPVWVNFGRNRKQLPISCYGSFASDTLEHIMDTASEIAMMTKMGGGTSVYLGKLRSKTSPLSGGGFSSGPSHLSGIIDTIVDVISQGSVRRGNCAAYMDIEHPDILDFTHWRQEGSDIKSLSWGACVGDDFINAVKERQPEELGVWREIVRCRISTGYPYLFFRDNVKKIHERRSTDHSNPPVASNLCSEILLPSTDDMSFVCCLASLNIAKWHDFKNTDAIEILVDFLNCVLDDFELKAVDIWGLERAVRFTKRYRAIGIGILGYHDFLQESDVEFEESEGISKLLQRHIKEKTYQRSQKLAELTTWPTIRGTNRVNLTTMAIAPTTTSSFLLGATSPSCEPLLSNFFVKDLAGGKYSFYSKHLMKLAESVLTGEEIEEFKQRLRNTNGSVQGENWLSNKKKRVFKCFWEMNQRNVIKVAAARQEYLDQAQSLNLLYIDNNGRKISDDLLYAHSSGLPCVYYHRGMNPTQMLIKGQVKQEEKQEESCPVCEA